jgi:membrane fusion protein
MAIEIPSYRKEAMVDPSLPMPQMPISWRIFGVMALVLCAALFSLLGFGSIARKEKVEGVLVLSKGELRVEPTGRGVVSNIYVSEGQHVRLGQKLLSISTEQETSEGNKNQQVLESIVEQMTALRSKMQSFLASSKFERQRLGSQLESEREQLRQLEASLLVATRKSRIAQETFERAEPLLPAGVISRIQLRDFEYDYLNQQVATSEIRTRILQVQASINNIAIQIANFPQTEDQQVQGMRLELSALEERHTAAFATNEYVLTARAEGEVTLMQARTGQAISPGQPLLTIMPSRSILYAQVFVPSRAVGFVKSEQKVRLMYDAFPFQRFGAAYGKVTNVSSTVLKPTEVASTVTVSEPVYAVDVALENQTVERFGRKHSLQPGMALSADIILEKQSILKLLFEPIFAAGARL